MKKLVIALALSGLTAMAQSVLSAKAGVVHYLDGEATINDQALEIKPNKFPDLKNGEVLRTTEGRVELLLAPGSFLRMGENSAVKMESNSVLATRIALLEGTALLEVAELGKDSSLQVQMGASTVTVRKAGLYRLEMTPGAVKVYDGEVAVNTNNELIKLGGGNQLTLSGNPQVAKFDKKALVDELYQWADQRASTIALANLHSANTVANGLTSSNQRLRASGWIYNTFYGMMTFVPYGNGIFSPFGYNYFNPYMAYQVYNPPAWTIMSADPGRSPSFNSDLGYMSTGTRSSSGYSGGGAPSMSAPVSGGERGGGAAAAGGARGGGAAGGGGARGGGGGGGI